MRGGGSLFSQILAKKPVVFIDEPHLLKGDAFSKKALEPLKSLLLVRFGATFPEEKAHALKNLAFRLDSLESFKRHLVKAIEVSTIEADLDSLSLLECKKDSFLVRVKKGGVLSKVLLKKGEDIGAKTGLASFLGVEARKVEVSKSRVYLSNESLLEKQSYVLEASELEAMLKRAIDGHFEKEEARFKRGFKSLSLFFIPSVADFRGENPRIKRLFEKLYKKKREEVLKTATNKEYKAYLARDFDAKGKLCVHQGYFSGDALKSGLKLAKEGKKTIDKEGLEAADIDLILKDKEKLLSFKSPLRFIFSVWALQEGWDNPNIFTLTKLQSSPSQTSRRQQVGRGLRLCVDQNGKRASLKNLEGDLKDFSFLNTLEVVVSAKEGEFIKDFQKEINENSLGTLALVGKKLDESVFEGLPRREKNILENHLLESGVLEEAKGELVVKKDLSKALKDPAINALGIEEGELETIRARLYSSTPIKEKTRPKKVRIRQAGLEKFKELWSLINTKARLVYKEIDEEKLALEVAREFNKDTSLHPAKMLLKKQVYDMEKNVIILLEEKGLDFEQSIDKAALALSFAKDLRVPLAFALSLFAKLDTQKLKARQALKLLKALYEKSLHSRLTHHIGYELENSKVLFKPYTSLQDESGGYISELDFTLLGKEYEENAPLNFLYEDKVYDSLIEKLSCEELNEESLLAGYKISVFAKLPSLKIPTPNKEYNPDFAYLLEKKDERLALVIEAKGYEKEADIPPAQKEKISYAKKYFKSLEAKGLKVAFKTRINRQSLSEILEDLKNTKE